MSWSLFLSSTVKDFKTYRKAVQAVCRRKVEIGCQLSEDGWPGGYDDVVAKCARRVREADCFILLAGYWYGSVPPDADRSITHLEFDHALRKWGCLPLPPLGVMMPEPGSRAFRDLYTLAERVLDEQDAAFDRSEHHRRLTDFHAGLTGAWRTIRRFKDKPDLREWAIADIKTWMGRGRTFLDASQGSVPSPGLRPASAAPTAPSDEQLGQIGRSEPQLSSIKAALASLAARPDVPALALIVHGAPDAGQRCFLNALPATAFRRLGPRQSVTRFEGDPALLPDWIARTLQLPPGGGVETVERLAGAVARVLYERPLYFMLDRIGGLPGGAVAFREGFWQPLYESLCRIKAARPFGHRLVGVVADYGSDPGVWQGVSSDIKPAGRCPDYSRLLAVPRLGNFVENDLFLWLEEQDVADQPPGRLAKLVARAMKDTGGAPLGVFEFLRGEPLWPEGDNP